jgi:hypothetical protein
MSDEMPISIPRFLRAESQGVVLRAVVIALFVCIVAITAARIANSFTVPTSSSQLTGRFEDFLNAVYFPATAYWSGVNPYSVEYAEAFPVEGTPAFYSPASFWLHLPFAMFPLKAASVVYFVFSILLVVALAASSLYFCGVPRTIVNVLVLSMLILVCRPGHLSLLLGQVTLPIVLGALWGIHWAKSRPWAAAVVLSITTLKPTFGVALIWLLFCRRNVRAALGAAAIGVLVATASMSALVLSDGWKPVLESLTRTRSLHRVDPSILPEITTSRIDIQVVLAKVAPELPDIPSMLIIAALCLLIAGWALFRTSGTPLGDGVDSVSGLIICTTALTCICHSNYDALLLVAPWVAASVGNLREQLPNGLRASVWLLLAIPAANYLLAKSVVEYFEFEGWWWILVTSLNALAILAVFLISNMVALRYSYMHTFDNRQKAWIPTRRKARLS